MTTQAQRVCRITLDWDTTDGVTVYRLIGHDDTGQLVFLGSTEQGPFDTALEIAQWAWRTIAREVPPAAC